MNDRSTELPHDRLMIYKIETNTPKKITMAICLGRIIVKKSPQWNIMLKILK
jgi:hypothetical protein